MSAQVLEKVEVEVYEIKKKAYPQIQDQMLV